MTARFTKNGRSYKWDGHSLPSVTTVKGILDKPGLVRWASNCSADSVVNDWEKLLGMTPTERSAHVRDASERAKNKAAERGTRVHKVAERILLGETVDDVPSEIRGMAESVTRLFDAWDMEPVITESPVAHSEWLYAGTLDAVVRCPRLGNVLIDYKTKDDGRLPYPDVSLQLAGYRFADTRLREVPQRGPRGGKLPSIWEQAPMVDVDRCAVIAVTHDAAQLVPMRADAAIFDVFLHLLEVHETWIRRTDGYRWKNDPAYDPTVGEPIHPEDDESTPSVWQESPA